VVLMHRECQVCRSEGLVEHARVLLHHAGVDLHVAVGEQVVAGQPLCTVHADAPGELAYAFDYAAANRDIIVVSDR
jgi:thymidine phosphorylase